MQPDFIRDLIEAGLPEAQAHVEGDGTHFSAVVVTPAFNGKTRLQKQQMVYDTVKSHLLDGSLHALSIKAFTPAEWEALDDGQGEA
jgi:acid stress-induced BolA-like protein IbaG/YrbA